METNRIPFSSLIGVENGLLLYRDSHQQRCSIELAVCAMRWAQAHPATEPVRHCCVGERWAPDRIVLYDQGHTVLMNDMENGRLQHLLNRLRIPLLLDNRRYARFRQVQQMLLNAGWTTYDMT